MSKTSENKLISFKLAAAGLGLSFSALVLALGAPTTTRVFSGQEVDADTLPPAQPYSTPSIVSSSDPANPLLNACGLAGTAPYTVNVNSNYNLSNCFAAHPSGQAASFTTSGCSGLAPDGAFTPSAEVASCSISAQVPASGNSLASSLATLDLTVVGALQPQTIAYASGSTPIPSPSSPLYNGSTHTISLSGVSTSVQYEINSLDANNCSATVNGNSVDVTSDIVSGTGTCRITVFAVQDGVNELAQSNSLTASLTVSGQLGQPSNFAITGTNDGTIYTGGTYDLGLENQAGSGTPVWSVSQSSIDDDICTIDASSGVVTPGAATGNCDVSVSIPANGNYAAASIGPQTLTVTAPRIVDALDAAQARWSVRTAWRYDNEQFSHQPLSGFVDWTDTNGLTPIYLPAESGDRAGSTELRFYPPQDYRGEVTFAKTGTCSSLQSYINGHPLRKVSNNQSYDPDQHDEAFYLRLRYTPTTGDQDCVVTASMATDSANGYEATDVDLRLPLVQGIARDGWTDENGTSPLISANRCLAGESQGRNESIELTGGVPPFTIREMGMGFTALNSFRTSSRVAGNPTTHTITEACNGTFYGTTCADISDPEVTFSATIRGRTLDLVAYWETAPEKILSYTGTMQNYGMTPRIIIEDANGKRKSANVQLSCDFENASAIPLFSMQLDENALNSAVVYNVPDSALSDPAGVTLSSLTPSICHVSGRAITALASSGTCRIQAQKGTQIVADNIIISNSNAALGWNDGVDVWSSCSIHSNVGTNMNSDFNDIACPSGKEWAPKAFVDSGACDGLSATGGAPATAWGHLFVRDGVWQNAGYENSVSALRQLRFYGVPFHDNFNNLSNRVQMKICASKNSVDPSTVAAAGTSTSGQAGPYTSTPYPTFGTRHAEVDIRSFGTTTLTSTTNRQPTSAGKHVAFKIRGGSDGDRLRFEEIKHILGASNLTDGAYNSSGLSDDSGNPLTIANNASGDDGWIIVGLGTRTGASGYTEGLAILEPTPDGTAPTSIAQTDELYLESRLTTGLVSEMCVVREIQASDTNQCPTGYTLATNAEIRRWPSCRHSSSATTVRTYGQGTFQWFYLHGADYQTYYDLTAGAQGASKTPLQWAAATENPTNSTRAAQHPLLYANDYYEFGANNICWEGCDFPYNSLTTVLSQVSTQGVPSHSVCRVE